MEAHQIHALRCTCACGSMSCCLAAHLCRCLADLSSRRGWWDGRRCGCCLGSRLGCLGLRLYHTQHVLLVSYDSWDMLK